MASPPVAAASPLKRHAAGLATRFLMSEKRKRSKNLAAAARCSPHCLKGWRAHRGSNLGHTLKISLNDPAAGAAFSFRGVIDASTSSAIPYQSDWRMGPARTETAAIPAAAVKARFAKVVPPAAIPVAWGIVWRATD
jgi:hypothetical protein